MNIVFGIDLGTTYSCIAYLDEYGKPVVLKNSDGDHTTPSVVWMENEQHVVVGTEAKNTAEAEPENTVQFIKRKMGQEDDKVMLHGSSYSAPEISAHILRKLVQDANDELKQTGVIQDGQEVKDVVITCPAYFGMNERQATKTAGELAGLNVLNIINEPTAAAISYGVSGQSKDETVLVYDLGGGTFDITIMKIHGSEISVVCTDGDDRLGGKDWDEKLIGYICQRYQEETGEDLSEDPVTYNALYVQVERWKKTLSSKDSVNITVNGEGGRLREALTRDKFEELTEGLLMRTKNMLDRALDTAAKQGCSFAQIDKILLVGGSSKMPQVAAMIERDYHVKPILQDPDEAVAKGAAIYAHNQKEYNDFVETVAAQTGQTVEELTEQNAYTHELDMKYEMNNLMSGGMHIKVTNVLSRTYGVEVIDQNRKPVIENILMVNSPLPATKEKYFSTAVDNQPGISIKIYESKSTDETMDIDGREYITCIDMTFRQSVPIHTEIMIRFSLDSAGILHVQAEELLNHSQLDTTFQLSNQMSESELRAIGTRVSKTTVE